jgi:hypothetical protein
VEHGGGSNDGLSLYVAGQHSLGEVPNETAIEVAESIALNAGFTVTEYGLFTLPYNVVQDQYSIFYDGTHFVCPLCVLISFK